MIWRSLILAGIVLGIFLIAVLTSRKKNLGDSLLIFWLFIISLQLLFYYDNLSPIPAVPKALALTGFALPILSSPLLYLYIASTTSRPLRLWPHMLFFLTYVIVINCFSARVYDGFPHFAVQIPGWAVNLLILPMALVPAGYALLTLVVLWNSKRILALSFVLLFLLQFIIIRFGVFQAAMPQSSRFALVGAILVLYVFFVGYLGLKPIAKPRYQNSGLDTGAASKLFVRLQLYMQQEQPYLDEELTLDNLAAKLAVSPNQLSQVINQQGASNFFSYINTYRVGAVKQKLTDPAYAHYSILAIAYDCGFRSKSSFNKIFKEITGQTPSAWQNTGLSLSVKTI